MRGVCQVKSDEGVTRGTEVTEEPREDQRSCSVLRMLCIIVARHTAQSCRLKKVEWGGYKDEENWW